MSLRQRVLEVVQAACPSVPWVLGRQNAPKHVKPYGTIDIRLLTRAGNPVILPVDGNGMQPFRFNVQFNAEINVYGSNAFETVLETSLRLSASEVVGATRKHALWVRGVDSVQDLTSVLGDSEQYEERGLLDMRMQGTLEYMAPVGTIERVIVEGKTMPWSLQMDLTRPEGIPDDIGDWLSGLGTIPRPDVTPED